MYKFDRPDSSAVSVAATLKQFTPTEQKKGVAQTEEEAGCLGSPKCRSTTADGNCQDMLPLNHMVQLHTAPYVPDSLSLLNHEIIRNTSCS